MKKPRGLRLPTMDKNIASCTTYAVNFIAPFYFDEIPALIKWLKKVQKYNEFKNKQKRKKVKNGK